MYVVNHNTGDEYIIWMFPKSGCCTVRMLHLYMLPLDAAARADSEHFDDGYHGIQERNDQCLIDAIGRYRTYRKILVYRDPYDRVASMFMQKIAGISGGITYKGIPYTEPVRLTQDMNSFEHFVDALLAGAFSDDEHFQPQKLPRRVALDKIVKIDNVYTMFNGVANSAHLATKIRHIGDKNTNVLPRSPKCYVGVDLSTYNFYLDVDGILKDRHIPPHSTLLSTRIRQKLALSYGDDFMPPVRNRTCSLREVD